MVVLGGCAQWLCSVTAVKRLAGQLQQLQQHMEPLLLSIADGCAWWLCLVAVLSNRCQTTSRLAPAASTAHAAPPGFSPTNPVLQSIIYKRKKWWSLNASQSFDRRHSSTIFSVASQESKGKEAKEKRCTAPRKQKKKKKHNDDAFGTIRKKRKEEIKKIKKKQKKMMMHLAPCARKAKKLKKYIYIYIRMMMSTKEKKKKKKKKKKERKKQ